LLLVVGHHILVPGLASSVGSPNLLLVVGHHVLVEQVFDADGLDHGVLHRVPLSVVVPGQEFLIIVQLLVGLHGVLGHVVRLM
jgi:hypothetical protein